VAEVDCLTGPKCYVYAKQVRNSVLNLFAASQPTKQIVSARRAPEDGKLSDKLSLSSAASQDTDADALRAQLPSVEDIGYLHIPAVRELFSVRLGNSMPWPAEQKQWPDLKGKTAAVFQKLQSVFKAALVDLLNVIECVVGVNMLTVLCRRANARQRWSAACWTRWTSLHKACFDLRCMTPSWSVAALLLLLLMFLTFLACLAR
jgi:hypothetical protein